MREGLIRRMEEMVKETRKRVRVEGERRREILDGKRIEARMFTEPNTF